MYLNANCFSPTSICVCVSVCDANDAAGTWNGIVRMPRKNKHYEYDYFAETLSFVGKRAQPAAIDDRP